MILLNRKLNFKTVAINVWCFPVNSPPFFHKHVKRLVLNISNKNK